jgi:hypothetical protein
MIGSLISRMGMAEKLSVAQIQKAVQDGTLPAYVGVPLIQDKLKQEQMAKAAATGAQQQQQPPVAQQVMQAADASEAAKGVDTLPSNLPTEEMAGGGIVAFAGGDLVEDEEEEDTLEERQQAAETQSLFNAMASQFAQGAESSAGIGSLAAAAPTVEKSKEIAYSINPESKGGFGIKDVIAAKAAENKLPPELLDRISYAESGHKLNVGNKLSSAKGLFGFTNGSWKSMGGTEENRFDPEANAELGAKLTRQNAEGLKKFLGRNPTYGEVYASHHFGLAGAKNLLQKDPNMPMVEAVSSEVIKANPYLKDKTVGQVMATLNKKMGEGIVALAKGGEVKRFGLPNSTDQLVMGDIEEGTDNPFAFMGDVGASSKDYDKKDYGIKKAIRNELMGVKTQEEANKDRFKVAPSKIPMGPTNEELKRPTAESQALENVTKELTPKEEGKGIDSAIPKEPTLEQKYMDLLKGREASTAKQRSVDNYMALLQAGLGMMGSTSPYALTGIGQGASTGIAAKMAAEKNRIAEEAATMKGYGNLYGTQQNAEMRKTLAGQTQDAAMRKQQFATMGNLEQRTRASIAASLDKSMAAMGLSDEEKARKVDQLTAQALAQSQAYKSAYKAYNGYDFAVQPAVGQGPVDYTGTYGLTPKK